MLWWRHCCSLKYHFLPWKYPNDVLHDAYQRASPITIREACHVKEEEQDKDKLVLVMTYNPTDSTLKDIIFHHWEILHWGTTMKGLGESLPTTGNRWPKNLRDMLVSAKIKKVDKQSTSKTPCSKMINICKTNRCMYCLLLDHSRRITSVCNWHVTCESNNLAFCITCRVCMKQYVGQTGGTLMDRLKAHYGSWASVTWSTTLDDISTVQP